MNVKGYVLVIVSIALLSIVLFFVTGCNSISKDFADYGIGASVETPIGDFSYEKEKKE